MGTLETFGQRTTRHVRISGEEEVRDSGSNEVNKKIHQNRLDSGRKLFHGSVPKSFFKVDEKL